ncbi:DUF6232 family protein [Streptomyces sp. NBC_01613]|uniref:DUF6232 family protein n=1 Tax=Streptomyces sp. NBC_01613 TaxID=2975896 RepID=UPI003868BED1
MAKSEVIDVRVSRRVLWVGAEAYPLHNIARATTIRIEPDRMAAVGRFLKSLLILAILTVAAVAVIGRVDWPSGSGQDALRGVVVFAVVMVAVFAAQLLKVLMTRTYYALVIETSGTPRAVLVSTDAREVGGLVLGIMDAISNPHAEFRTQIITYNSTHIGDKINQIGGIGNVGKRVGS